jgi:hypothetical protein
VTFLAPAAADAADADTPARPTILVPATAVVTRDGRQGVFEIVDGTARLRPIAAAGTRRDLIIVTDGLVGSERLVAQPTEAVTDGVRVAIRSSGEGAQ